MPNATGAVLKLLISVSLNFVGFTTIIGAGIMLPFSCNIYFTIIILNYFPANGPLNIGI